MCQCGGLLEEADGLRLRAGFVVGDALHKVTSTPWTACYGMEALLPLGNDAGRQSAPERSVSRGGSSQSRPRSTETNHDAALCPKAADMTSRLDCAGSRCISESRLGKNSDLTVL